MLVTINFCQPNVIYFYFAGFDNNMIGFLLVNSLYSCFYKCYIVWFDYKVTQNQSKVTLALFRYISQFREYFQLLPSFPSLRDCLLFTLFAFSTLTHQQIIVDMMVTFLFLVQNINIYGGWFKPIFSHVPLNLSPNNSLYEKRVKRRRLK